MQVVERRHSDLDGWRKGIGIGGKTEVCVGALSERTRHEVACRATWERHGRQNFKLVLATLTEPSQGARAQAVGWRVMITISWWVRWVCGG